MDLSNPGSISQMYKQSVDIPYDRLVGGRFIGSMQYVYAAHVRGTFKQYQFPSVILSGAIFSSNATDYCYSNSILNNAGNTFPQLMSSFNSDSEASLFDVSQNDILTESIPGFSILNSGVVNEQQYYCQSRTISAATTQATDTLTFVINQSVEQSYELTKFQVSSVQMPSCASVTPPEYQYLLTFNANGTALPVQFSIDSSSSKLAIKLSPNYQQKGSFQALLTGTLFNLYTSSTVLNIVAEGNYGPPIFTTDLINQDVAAGSSLKITLPTITDPDRDGYTVSFDFGTAINFSLDDLISGIYYLTFSPDLTEQEGIHTIAVTLSDNNKYPESSRYTFALEVFPAIEYDGTAQNCYIDPYPKIIGCDLSTIQPLQMEASDIYLAITGFTDPQCLDEEQIPGIIQYQPFIILYDIESGSQLWMRYYLFSNGFIKHVKFFNNKYLFAVVDTHFNYLIPGHYNRILKVDINTGQILKNVRYTQSQFTFAHSWQQLLIDSQMNVYTLFLLYNATGTSTSIKLLKTHIFSSVGSTENDWALQSVQINIQPLGIVFDNNQKDIFFSYSENNTDYYLSRFTEKLFLPEEVNTLHKKELKVKQQKLQYQKLDQQDQELIIIANQFYTSQYLTLSRVLLNSTSKELLSQNTYLHDSLNTNYSTLILDLRIINNDLVHVLIYDKRDRRTYLNEYNLLDSPPTVYQNYIEPFTLRREARKGIIINDQKQYFALALDIQMTLTNKDPSPLSLTDKFMILTSSNVSDTCLSLGQPYRVLSPYLFEEDLGNSFEQVQLNLNHFVIQQNYATALELQPETDPVTITSEYVNSTKLRDAKPYCKQGVLAISTTQSKSQVFFKVNQAQTQIANFDQFTVSREGVTCANPANFKYQVEYTNMPNNIYAFSNQNYMAKLTISSNIAQKGSYQLRINGMLPTKQIGTTSMLSIIIEGNFGAPSFQPAFKDQQVQAGKTLDYTFPSVIDPDLDLYTIKVEYPSGGSNFMAFENGILHIKPDSTLQDKSYQVSVTVIDQNKYPLQSQSSFFVKVISIKPTNQPPLPLVEVVQQASNSSNNSSSTQNNSTSSGSTSIFDVMSYLPKKQTSGKKTTGNKPTSNQPKITLPDPTIRLSSISNRGLLTLTFSDQLFYFDGLFNATHLALSLTFLPTDATSKALLVSWQPVKAEISNTTDEEGDYYESMKSLQIQLNFTNPLYISQGQIADRLMIEVKQGALFKRISDLKQVKDNLKLFGQIPPQLFDSAAIKSLEKFGGYASNTMSYTVYGNLGLQIFMSASMSLLWGLMNTMQLIIHQKLLNVMMPANAQYFLSFMVNLVNFKLFPTKVLIAKLFNMLQDDDEDDGDSLQAKELGYSSKNVLQSLGLLVLGVLVMALVIGFVLLLHFFQNKYPLAKKVYNTLKSKLFFNILLRSLLETYLKLSVSALTSVPSIDFNGSKDQLISSITTLGLICGVVIGFPWFTYKFLSKNQPRLHEEHFIRNFGTLYLNLDTQKKRYSVLMTVMFIGRRLIFAMCVTFLKTQTLLLAQISIVVFSSLTLIYFIITVKPFSDPLLNFVEGFNELTLLVTSYFLFSFTDLAENPETRYMMGWFYSAVVGLNLVVNWCVLFYRLLKQIGAPLVDKLNKLSCINRLKQMKFRKKQKLYTRPRGVSDVSTVQQFEVDQAQEEAKKEMDQTRQLIEEFNKRFLQLGP